jgi:hypothetical protein
MVGFLTHVRRDERAKVAKVGVRLDATQQESGVVSATTFVSEALP